MKQISSKSAGIVRTVKQLHQKKHRDKEGLLLAEGYHLLEEVLKCRMKLEFVVFSQEAADSDMSKSLLKELENRKVQIFTAPEGVFKTMALTESPQGVLTVCQKPVFDEKTVLNKPGSNWLVLDRVQDPGNVGTMIRTAEAAGYRGVFAMKGTADVYGDKVIRSAAGSVFRMPVFFYEDPKALLAALLSAGKKPVAAAAEAKTRYDEVPLYEDIALIIGNEAGGVCRAFKDQTVYNVRIPMAGETESLNAAVAAGILMYEKLRYSPNQGVIGG